MAETITQQLLRQSLDLSYAEIEKEHPEWSKRAIDDYFYKQSNINTLAISNEGVEAQVILNTSAITVNANNLTNHINDPVGAHAASAISFINTVSGLTAIEVQAAIDELDGMVDTNTANITSVTNAFNTHNGSNSQHGATGANVGTGDFAQTALGGVVFLADLVNNAVASTVSVTSADATDLATVITLANELKADVNQLVTDFNNSVTQLNDIIQQMKDAKQMSLT